MNEIKENESVQKKAPRKLPKLPKMKRGSSKTIYIILMIVMITMTVIFGKDIVGSGAKALADSYNAAYASEYDATYQALYQKYFDAAEAKYHVRNEVLISIGDIKETEKLEVLKVSDVEFIVEDKNSNDGNITSWLEVPGEGTFVVDLQAAEFVIDNERAHVLVRAPYPELTNVSIDYGNVQKILFKDDIFNGSYKEGEELAQKQLNEGDLLIKKEFASNQNFYLSAQEAAISSIQCLVRQMNPGVDNLMVDVEFY